MELIPQLDPHRNGKPERRRVDMKVSVSDISLHSARDAEKALAMAQKKLYEQWGYWTAGLNVLDCKFQTVRDEARLQTTLRLLAELSPPTTDQNLSVQIQSMAGGFQASMTHATRAITQMQQSISQGLGAALNTHVANTALDIRQLNNNYYKYKNRD